MSSGYQEDWRFQSAEATAAFAARLAPKLQAGDVILLTGDLGAGKTHFARAVIQARLSAVGRAEDVPSPTFTLVQTYDDGALELWHADLYRLIGPEEVEELGLAEAFDSGICLVEWPDRLEDLTPGGALELRFQMTEVPGERLMAARSDNARWAEVLRNG